VKRSDPRRGRCAGFASPLRLTSTSWHTRGASRLVGWLPGPRRDKHLRGVARIAHDQAEHLTTLSIIVKNGLESRRITRLVIFGIEFASFLPVIGFDFRFADGDGYRSKEPINVSNVPFPILSARRFPMWKRHTPLLYMFRLCGSPVSWVR
jgi:hypothetical protein